MFKRAILIIFAIKIALALLFPLTSDEGYYWLWSKHLAFTYVDHPPMIAWINWLLQRVFWEPLISLRAGALIFNVLIAWVLLKISEELFKSDHQRNLLLFLLIPNTLIIWLVLTVELPFVLFYLLTVLFFIKFLKTKKDSCLYQTGVWVGLGLITKYTMILIYPAILIFVLTQKKFRYLLTRASFWLSGLLGLVIFSPIAILSTIQKSESLLFHVARVGATPWFSDLGTFVAEQLIYLSPFLAYFIIRFYEDRKAREYRQKNLAVSFVWLAGLVPFVFFLLLSFKTHVWPHWPVVSYGIFAVLIGFWFKNRPIKWMIGFDTLLLIVLLFASPGIVSHQKDYWSNYQLSGKIKTFLKSHPQTLFASDYHGSVAQLSYYGRVNAFLPTGLLAVDAGTWGQKQFARWNINTLNPGADLVILTEPGSDLYQKAQPYFYRVEPLPNWHLSVMEGHLQHKRFFWFKGFKSQNSQSI